MNTINHKGFFWTYDASADVLHVSKDPSLPAYGEELENFENLIVILRDIETDELIGLRVLGARRNGLQRVRVELDRARGAIQSFQIDGKLSPPPAARDPSYVDELVSAEKILERSPPDLQLA